MSDENEWGNRAGQLCDPAEPRNPAAQLSRAIAQRGGSVSPK